MHVCWQRIFERYAAFVNCHLVNLKFYFHYLVAIFIMTFILSSANSAQKS